MTFTMRVLNEDGWRLYERKDLRIQVCDGEGNPASLNGLDLRYQLRREANGQTVYIEKTTLAGDITIEDADEYEGDQSVAVVAIQPEDYVGMPWRIYWHALRDDSADLMLGEALAYIGPGVKPPEDDS